MPAFEVGALQAQYAPSSGEGLTNPHGFFFEVRELSEACTG